jgi:flagellar basal-body rod protein FlgC
MSLLKVFDISSSAMTAQSQRLNVVASNLANAESATGPGDTPYHAKQVVFSTVAMGRADAAGVRVSQVVEDPSPMRRLYQPGNPLADGEGYVTLPNVNVVEEMVNMLSASRAYQNNADLMNAAKTMMLHTLNLGQ